MARILPRIAVMLHVAFIAIYLAWMRGGTVPDPVFYGPLPWLAAGLVEMILLFPLLKKGETDADGRSRVVRSLLSDPVFYLGVLFLAYVGIQCANGPCELQYDVEAAQWKFSPPPLDGWPFSVSRAEAGQLLYWYAPVFAVILAMRHGLSRRAKLNLLRVLVVSSALLSLLGILQFLSGTHKVYWITPLPVQFFASFGYPNHAGSFFTLSLAISIGLLIQDVVEQSDKGGSTRWIVVCAVCAVLNLLGASFSLCRAGILLSWSIALLGIVYAFAYLAPRLPQSAKLRLAVSVALGIGVAAFFYFVAYPDNAIRHELSTLRKKIKARPAAARVENVPADGAAAAAKERKDEYRFDNPFAADRKRLAGAAIDIWRDYPWMGVGGWGYRHFIGLYVPEQDWKYIRSRGRANVHNDFLQYLCEQGVIGFGLLLGTVVLLLVPFWHRLFRILAGPPPDGEENAARLRIFRVPPVAWFLLAGTTAVVVHSLIDLPFRCPAIIVLWFISLCTMSAVLPRTDPKVSGKPGSPHAESGGRHDGETD